MYKSQDFIRGFTTAIADLIRQYDEPTIALSLMRYSGISYEDMKDAECDKFDLEIIKLEIDNGHAVEGEK